MNADLMGQGGGRDEPGIVLQLRQRQGSVVIEKLNDNWRRTRKLTGQLLVDFIQKERTYTAEEVQDIVGRDKEQNRGIFKKIKDFMEKRSIGRVMEDLSFGKYGIKIDMVTSSPTIKMSNYQQLIDAAVKYPPGVIPFDLLIEAHPDLQNKEEILERMRSAQAGQEGGTPTNPTGTPGPETPGSITPPTE